MSKNLKTMLRIVGYVRKVRCTAPFNERAVAALDDDVRWARRRKEIEDTRRAQWVALVGR